MKPARILVTLTGTEYVDAAIDHALELALLHGAEIVGVTDLDLSRIEMVGMVPIGAVAAAADLVEHRRIEAEQRIDAAIARLQNACRDASVPCIIHRETGEPFETVARSWRFADFTIASLQGLFDYGVVREPDKMLIRLIRRGIRPMLATARVARPIRRVLIAYNGSMEASKALKQFCWMNLWPKVEVDLVCYRKGVDDAPELLEQAAAFCRRHRFEKVQTFVQEGSPRDHLHDFAVERQCDLVVMGATARARIFSNLLGDTAERMIRDSVLPLFLSQ